MNEFENEKNEGMTLIVKTVTRLTFGLILLYGLYIAIHGHLTPGGGFAGGVICALAFVNLILAYGQKVALGKLGKEVASLLEGIGALVFITLAVVGFAGGYFFLNIIGKGEPYRLFSAGMIPFYNIAAILFKVSAGLLYVFVVLGLASYKRRSNK
jgi:multicomponent Na+:H+ antiporter subunit B